MEVIEKCSCSLSNKEVLDILNSKVYKKHTNLATILYETTEYLNTSGAASVTREDITNFLNIIKMKKYELTKIEKIQIVNIRPQNEVELHLIVEMIEERFNEEQRDDLISIINNTLINHLQMPLSHDEDKTRKKFKTEPDA